MSEEGCTNGYGTQIAVDRTVRPTNGVMSNRELRITIVGDSMVGKNALLMTYLNKFFIDYRPMMRDVYRTIIEVDNIKHNVELLELGGLVWDSEKLRPLGYINTDCFLLCYSINNKSSFDNILQKWYPELRHHCPDVPILLIGTKSDLRGSEETFISMSEVKKLKRNIQAIKYMECSALKNEGLTEIFEEAV